jgi:hypothetical protein
MLEAIALSCPTILQQHTLVCLKGRGFRLSSSMVATREEDPYDLEKLSGHMIGRSLHHHIFSISIDLLESRNSIYIMDESVYLILNRLNIGGGRCRS